jgi:outer membrane protein, multidrug efflux system
VGASWIRQKNSTNLVSPNLSQFRSGGPQVFSPGSTFSIFNLPLSLTYEIDVWRKNRLQTKSAQLRYQAEALKLRDMELALTEHTVKTALTVFANDAFQQLLQSRLTVLEEIQHLQRDRYEAGLEAKDAYLERRQAIEALQVELLQRQEEAKRLNHELAFMVGKSSTEFQWKTPDVSALAFFEQVPLPYFGRWKQVDVNQLLHRPDVGMSELELQASGLDVKVARRLFLPSFTINAQVGLASTTLNQWFDWNSVLASFGTSMAQQLFAGGALKANLKEQKARFEQKGRLYQNQLLLAGRKSEDAIVGLTKALEKASVIEQQRLLAEERFDLMEARYKVGLENYLPTLEQRHKVLQKWEEEVYIRQQVLLAWNTLQRELGGGF